MTALPWQQQNWAHLCSFSAQNRVPQALLISGNKGLGKLQLAQQFAHTLLCEKTTPDGYACGHCHSCSLIHAESHPDLIYITPEAEKQSITVDQIRALIIKTQLKPQYEANRVVIVNPADTMNTNAANAFLKCLEEPSERTVIVLITDKPAKLPATIKSRCQKMIVAAPSSGVFAAYLKQQGVHDNIAVLYSLSHGSPFQALDYAATEALPLRRSCFDEWLKLANQKSHPAVTAENWLKHPEDALLFWMTTWIIDLIKCSLPTREEQLYNPDLYRALSALAQKISLKELYKYYDLLLISRRRLETQINKQTLFEEILTQWFELNRSKKNG